MGDMLANALLQTQGYNAFPQIARSQYVANALHAMQANPPNIRTPTALWSNLAADALLQMQQGRALRDVSQGLSQSTQQQADFAKSGAFGDTGQQAQQQQPTGQVSTNLAAQGVPQQQQPTAQPQGQQPAAPANLADAEFNQFWAPHEGRGAMDVNGHNAFYGMNTAFFPQINANSTKADAEQAWTSGVWQASGADKIANPTLAVIHADTAGLSPGWAARILQQSGGDPAKYMQLRQQAMLADVASNPAKFGPVLKGWENRNRDLWTYAQSLSPQGQPQGQGAPQQPVPGLNMQPVPMGPTGNGQGVQAVQRLPGGPAPMPGPNGQGMIQPAPMAQQPPPPNPQAMGVTQQPMGATQGAPPMQQGGPPTGPVATPQERAQINWGLAQPPGSGPYMAALQLAQQVAHRAATPVELKPDEAYDQSGRAQFIGPQAMQFTQGLPPNTIGERGPDGKVTFTGVPGGKDGSQVWDPQQGRYVTAPGLGTTQVAPPAPGIRSQQGPDGKITDTPTGAQQGNMIFDQRSGQWVLSPGYQGTISGAPLSKNDTFYTPPTGARRSRSSATTTRRRCSSRSSPRRKSKTTTRSSRPRRAGSAWSRRRAATTAFSAARASRATCRASASPTPARPARRTSAKRRASPTRLRTFCARRCTLAASASR